MKNTKAFLVILLIALSFMAVMPQSMAATSYRYEPEAYQLNRLGLFAGASLYSFNPDLGATLDRQVGVTLLLNFFGMRDEVEALPTAEVDKILSLYTDQSLVSSWARPYMAYAVQMGIIVGTSPVTIGPLKPLDGVSYAAMILRRLGYTINRSDFISSLKILYEKGGINASEIALFDKVQLIKNDAVGMVYTTLYANCADGKTLLENLVLSEDVSAHKAVSLKLARYIDPDNIEMIKPETPVIPRPTAYDQVYYGVLEALVNAAPSVKLTISPFTDTAQEVFDLVEACVRDNPEILYYSGCTYYSNGLLTLQYSKSPEVVIKHTTFLKEKVDMLTKQLIKPDMTEYEKELAIHNYIVENCEYDIDGYESSQISSESYSAYGVLCLGTGVCEGYAEATKLLLNRVGVMCEIITGTSKGEGHAWNLVKIGGEYYHLDVTWDDPVMADGSNILSHHYFNITDQDMSLDHDWDRNNYPICKAADFNYYVYNKLVVPGHEEFISLVVDRVQKGTTAISVKILNTKAVGFNYDLAIKTVCEKLYRDCVSIINEKLGIVDLRFN